MKTMGCIQKNGCRRITSGSQSPEYASHGIVAVNQIKPLLLKKFFQLSECSAVFQNAYRRFFDQKMVGNNAPVLKKMIIIVIYGPVKI